MSFFFVFFFFFFFFFNLASHVMCECIEHVIACFVLFSGENREASVGWFFVRVLTCAR